MMLLEMPCFTSSAQTKVSGSAVQPCLHSWPCRRKRISLMRKKIELARQGFKLLGWQSHCTNHGGSAAERWGGVPNLYPRPDRQQGQVRCASCGPNAEPWQRKKIVDRDQEEARRMQHTSRYRSSSSSSQAAFKQSIVRQASPAAAEGASSAAHVAFARANPDDPAQRSHDWPAVHTVQPVSSADIGNKSQRPATAAQPSLDLEAAEHIVLEQDDLHSPAVSLLSSLKLESASQDELLEDTTPTTEDVGVVPADICVVDTAEEARRVVNLLRTTYKTQDWFFACDTEVKDINLSKESPCGHGTVTCFSIYGGKSGSGEVCNFAADPSGPPQDRLWVDTMLDDQELNKELFVTFKEFFEDEGIKKVWHNYSFDRHVLHNHGIDCRGFAADTMHMARLWDSSRQGKGYSLESLTGDKKLMADYAADLRSKTGMKSLFGRKNIKKDNTEGKLTVLPPVEELQTDPQTRAKWIDYSAYDAKATWQLAQALKKQLMARPCVMDKRVQHAVQAATGQSTEMMIGMYNKYWQPFGLLLTDMERQGMSVNRRHLEEAEVRAVKDQAEAMDRFRSWASQKVPGAQLMNVGSGAQIRQLFFAGVQNQKGDKGTLETERVFKALNTEGWVDPNSKTKKPRKNIDFSLHSLWGLGAAPVIQPEVFTASGWPAVSTPVLRALAGKPGAAKRALQEQYGESTAAYSSGDDIPIEAIVEDSVDSSLDVPLPAPWDDVPATASGEDNMQAVAAEPQQPTEAVAVSSLGETSAEMEEEANKKGYGRAYAAFGGGRDGLEACAAIDALCELGAIDTLLSNFIKPLQGSEIATVDSQGNLDRVHCSLNINTETGRLSARRPNLQNQPALEKDRYKVRKAFTADVSKGHTLVVADYGQLELRILAHLAGCTSMINAFKLGGDFHSRTALGMYDHIKAAISKGECMLEWDGEGKPPVPLLKEMFAAERRKAKVLNFSIAYGKTAHGLSKDWKVSLDEAQNTVNRWYADRPEVRIWQTQQQDQAKSQGYVCTLLGRQRQLPDAGKKGPGTGAAAGHALRAAINTPVQGSAADVATAAMISINNCQRLKELGWKLLLQVHDEVILEGPKDSAVEAQKLVLSNMERPFDGQNPLLVALVVDSKIADTWYEAK
ncbi:hypothetical protein ABBQ32_006185 [Trebouxia sp. C0010 RCD-2024]